MPIYRTDNRLFFAPRFMIAMNFQTVAAANNYWRK